MNKPVEFKPVVYRSGEVLFSQDKGLSVQVLVKSIDGFHSAFIVKMSHRSRCPGEG